MGAIPKRQAVSNQRGLATGRYFVAAFAVWREIWGLATALAATLNIAWIRKGETGTQVESAAILCTTSQ
jgi:hypothetical protein